MQSVRLIVAALAAALAAAPALAAEGPHIDMGACPGREAELMKILRAYTDCVSDQVEATAAGDEAPETIADAALAACAGRKTPAEAFYKACRLGDGKIAEQVRDNAIETVNEKRRPSRADRIWVEMITADTGDCRLQAEGFTPMVSAHLDCMNSAFGADGDYAVGFGGLADKALAACAKPEAPLRSRIAQCAAGRGEEMMASYRAYAREWAVSSVLASALEEKPDNIPDPRARTEEIREAMVSYEGCFIVETRLRVLAGGGKQKAQSGAAEACAGEGKEMARIARERLGEAGEAAFRHHVVMEAIMFASQGLPADAKP